MCLRKQFDLRQSNELSFEPATFRMTHSPVACLQLIIILNYRSGSHSAVQHCDATKPQVVFPQETKHTTTMTRKQQKYQHKQTITTNLKPTISRWWTSSFGMKTTNKTTTSFRKTFRESICPQTVANAKWNATPNDMRMRSSPSTSMCFFIIIIIFRRFSLNLLFVWMILRVLPQPKTSPLFWMNANQ